MASTVDHEVTAVKEDIFTHSSQEARGTACHLGPCGEAPGLCQRAELGEEKHELKSKAYVMRQAERLKRSGLAVVIMSMHLGAKTASGGLVSGAKVLI